MHLHIDCQFGMAGDMLLAALIDAGADKDAIVEVLRAIPLPDFELETSRAVRGGVAATLADVKDLTAGCCGHGHGCGGQCGSPRRDDMPRPDGHAMEEHFDPHDHPHADIGGHDHNHDHPHDHPHPHPHADDAAKMHFDPHDHPHADIGGHDDGQEHAHEHPHPRQRPWNPDEHFDPHSYPHVDKPEHDRAHIHDLGHGAHDHGHAHGHSHSSGGPHRHLGDLLALLDSPAIARRVRERAAKAFRIMAEAEAAVHGRPVDKVHFHEISGIDTAVDVIGSCVALELLDVDSVSASPPSVGSGMVMCDHGIFPVPAPATLEILKSRGIPWRSGGEGERATPTGMALLAALAEAYGDSPEISVTRIGYGAGHREFADVPNLVRVIVGKPGPAAPRERPGSKTIIAASEPEIAGEVVRFDDRAMPPAEMEKLLPDLVRPGGDRVVEFRFAVDDMTAEAIGFLIEQCLAHGAVDAYAIPAIMKKSRPGQEITVLCPPDQAAEVADVVWRESTTFGMRVGERSRLTLRRDSTSVEVFGHRVRVKLGWLGGVVIRRQPEYEDCRAVSLATGKPLAEVFRAAMDAE